jgi:hypothetical protein
VTAMPSGGRGCHSDGHLFRAARSLKTVVAEL